MWKYCIAVWCYFDVILCMLFCIINIDLFAYIRYFLYLCTLNVPPKRSFFWYINLPFALSRRYPEDTPKIEYEKTIANIRFNLHFADCNLCPYLWCYSASQVANRLLTYFYILHIHIITLSHIFMSEFSRHTAKLPETYFSKKSPILGGIGVVYNYIHSIYYIFFDRYAIRHIFLCDSVIVW